MRYLLVTYKRKPAGQIDEEVGFTTSLKTRDLQSCNVIIDYKEQKIIKCVVEGNMIPTTFESLTEYYRRAYPTVIEQLELATSARFEKK